jgi:hypothetical protein
MIKIKKLSHVGRGGGSENSPKSVTYYLNDTYEAKGALKHKRMVIEHFNSTNILNYIGPKKNPCQEILLTNFCNKFLHKIRKFFLLAKLDQP